MRLQNGFTLIEILVVTGVIVLFSGISISYFNQFTEEKKLVNHTKKIMNAIELTKSKTNSFDNTLCRGGINITPLVQNYTFQTGLGPGANQFKIIPSCLYGTPVPVSYSAESGIVMPTRSVVFNKLYAPVTCTCILSRSDILNKCRYVKVTEAGVIEDGDCNECNTCSVCSCP